MKNTNVDISDNFQTHTKVYSSLYCISFACFQKILEVNNDVLLYDDDVFGLKEVCWTIVEGPLQLIKSHVLK